jgi:WD40 repeat protein
MLTPTRQHPPVTIELPHPVTSASLHPFLRDRFVAGSTKDPWVRVYDLDSGKEKEVYKGHHGPVLCASYSPDGEVYASGSEDGGFLFFVFLLLLLFSVLRPGSLTSILRMTRGEGGGRTERICKKLTNDQGRYACGRRIQARATVYGRRASRDAEPV